METVKSKCVVVGPGGFLRSPLARQGLTKDEYYAKGSLPNKGQQGQTFEEEFLMTPDVARELAQSKAEQHPGSVYHILETTAAFVSEIKPPIQLKVTNAQSPSVVEGRTETVATQ